MEQKRCAIYTRKSVEDGLEQEFNSLDAQRSFCEAFIKLQKHNGWVCLPKHYDDAGWSGKNMDRPAFRLLLEDIAAEMINVIVVYKIDRLSRSLLDFAELNRYLEQYNVGFVSVTQDINTNTSSGRMLWNILMTFAQFERETISERVRDKIAESKRLGKFCGGMTPMGYKRNQETRRLDIDPRESAVVRWMFRNYLKMKSCGLVAKALNHRAVRTRQWISSHNIEHGGKSWSTARVHSIITNPIYISLIRHCEKMFPGEHEPLVSQKIWDQTQELLALKSTGHYKHSRHRESAILTSLLRSKECDCALTATYTNKNRKRYFYYACQKSLKFPDHVCSLWRFPVKEIDEIIVLQLAIVLQCYSFREAIVNETERQRQEYRRKIIKERSALRTLIKNVKDEDTINRLKTKIVELTNELKIFQDEVKHRIITSSLEKFNKLWNSLVPALQIEILDSLIERIDVSPTTVRTFFHNENEYSELQAEVESRLKAEKSLWRVFCNTDGQLVFETPIAQRRLNGRNRLEIIGVNYNENRRCLLHAISMSWKWNELLSSQTLKNIPQLAQHVNFSTAYVGRILALSNLAPSIVEDIVNGNIPESLSLARLHEGFPDDWKEQRKKLGFVCLKD